MKTDAEKRVALVEAMNGASANLASAKVRLDKATAALAQIVASRAVTKECYMKSRERLAPSNTQIDAAERLQVIAEVNQYLEVLDIDSKTWQRARSEEGVAKGEVEKFETELLNHASALAKLLPEV